MESSVTASPTVAIMAEGAALAWAAADRSRRHARRRSEV